MKIWKDCWTADSCQKILFFFETSQKILFVAVWHWNMSLTYSRAVFGDPLHRINTNFIFCNLCVQIMTSFLVVKPFFK